MLPSIKLFIHSATARLAATYLAIIMLMSISFSIVFYNTSSGALNRNAPPNETVFGGSDDRFQNQRMGQITTNIRNFLDDQAEAAREDLIVRLLMINLLTLIAGAGISYYLARRTLKPIEANMEAQRQFVSDASHELRTPLTAIQTSNDVALRNKKLTLADAKAVIQENSAEAAKLKQLSDGLLDLAKNGQQPLPLVAVNVQAAVQIALNQVVTAAQSKDISVEDTSSPVLVSSNEHVLSQLLVILLDNAIKYSHPNSTIYVGTTMKGNYVYVHVKDEGVGIRASDIPFLFRRFYRADNARRDGHTEGYGLGLAIADTLAQLHGASISVVSELEKGSTFTIKLTHVK